LNLLLQLLRYSSSDFTFPSTTEREIAKALSTLLLRVRTQTDYTEKLSVGLCVRSAAF